MRTQSTHRFLGSDIMTQFDWAKGRQYAKTAAWALWVLCAPLMFLAGITGAIQAFYYEIDEGLNPGFYEVPVSTPALPAPELIARLEAKHPELKVWYIQSAAKPGRTAMLTTQPRGNEPLANDTFYVDPATGREVGARLWGKCCLEPENFLNWTYELHHSLTIGEPGRWIMGLTALVGMAACLIVIGVGYRRRDRISLVSAGLCVPCLVFAITCIDMNLGDELFKPTVSLISKVTPDVYTVRGEMKGGFGERRLSYEDALSIGKAEGIRRGYGTTVGELYYSYGYNFYGMAYGYRDPNGLGNHWLYFDGQTGKVIGGRFPGEGSLGDRFTQFQLPIHSGRIGGMLTKTLVCLLGLLIAGIAAASLIKAGRQLATLFRALYGRAHKA
jgi:uncharacterized iron-regulated membrane protein